MYSIAVNTFIAGGGDDYTMLSQGGTGEGTMATIDSGLPETVVLADYLKKQKADGVVKFNPSDFTTAAKVLPCDDSSGVCARIKQSDELLVVTLGAFCRYDDPAAQQECDVVYHTVDRP